MNKYNVGLVCTYLIKKDVNSYRQCDEYLRKIVGMIYFNNVLIDAKKINIENRYLFREFAHKYKLILNLTNIKEIKN